MYKYNWACRLHFPVRLFKGGFRVKNRSVGVMQVDTLQLPAAWLSTSIAKYLQHDFGPLLQFTTNRKRPT